MEHLLHVPHFTNNLMEPPQRLWGGEEQIQVLWGLKLTTSGGGLSLWKRIKNVTTNCESPSQGLGRSLCKSGIPKLEQHGKPR